MATGDSTDILSRVKSLIPFRWFSYAAPLRDAVIGGLSDSAAWCYSLIAYARKQSRIATSEGPFLDLIAYDFLGRYLTRRALSDDAFRSRIMATILQERVTRAGVINVVTKLTGKAPTVFEPWNTGDTGGLGTSFMGYNVAGAWGTLGLPAQAFITAVRPGVQGVPNVSGFNDGGGGWGVGSLSYISLTQIVGAVTDADIYDSIAKSKPTGVVAWTAIVSSLGSYEYQINPSAVYLTTF